MAIAGARSTEHESGVFLRGRKRGRRRGASEPRLSMSDKQELIARLEHSWMKQAENYWQIAESECRVAKEWYETMAQRYIDHKEKGSVLALGPGGHLVDHRYQEVMQLKRMEPNFTSFDTGLSSVFATCVENLGRLANHDNEPVLRRKLSELLNYCHRLEDHNDRLIRELLLTDGPNAAYQPSPRHLGWSESERDVRRRPHTPQEDPRSTSARAAASFSFTPRRQGHSMSHVF